MTCRGLLIASLFCLLSSGLLAGCSSAQPLDPTLRTSLSAIQLERAIEGEVSVSGNLPGPYDVGPSNGFYGTPYTAPIGFMYDLWHWGEYDAKKARAFKKILRDRNIDVVATVQTTAETALASKHFFAKVIVMPAIEEEDPLAEVAPASQAVSAPPAQPSAATTPSHLASEWFPEAPVFTESDWARALPLLDLSESDFPAQQIPDVDIDWTPAAPDTNSDFAADAVVTGTPVSSAHVAEAIAAIDSLLDTDAQLQLRVDYGVRNIGVVDEAWLPWVRVTGTLVDRSGEVLWCHAEEANAENGVVTQLPFPSPFQDAAYVKRNYDTGARVATQRVLLNLQGD